MATTFRNRRQEIRVRTAGVRLAMARLWVEAVNGKGGHAHLVHLPDIGIRGNTHFPFSDLNNTEVADLLSGFLAESGLDGD